MIYVEKFEDMINEDIDEWVYFFKHGTIREDFKSPGILLAAKKLDYLMMSEEERRGYDDYLAYLGQELGILDTAKEEGREEGRVLTAKAALNKGLAVELISEITGLTLEEILKLQSDISLKGSR
jgi:predicted transposase/invertase (TIGR01784 family)